MIIMHGMQHNRNAGKKQFHIAPVVQKPKVVMHGVWSYGLRFTMLVTSFTMLVTFIFHTVEAFVAFEGITAATPKMLFRWAKSPLLKRICGILSTHRQHAQNH